MSGIGQKVRRMIVKRYRGFMKQLLDLFFVGKRTFQVEALVCRGIRNAEAEGGQGVFAVRAGSHCYIGDRRSDDVSVSFIGEDQVP